MPKNRCFWTVVLEKTLESPLDCKEIQPIHPKGDQSRVFIGRTDVEVETPILWPPDAKNWSIRKDPNAGKDWGQEEKGMTEDEMVGWHHWLDGHGFGWTRSWWWTGRPGVLWFMGSQRVRHDWVNWTELNVTFENCIQNLKIKLINESNQDIKVQFWLWYWNVSNIECDDVGNRNEVKKRTCYLESLSFRLWVKRKYSIRKHFRNIE